MKKLIVVMLAVVALTGLIAVPVFAEDKLIVKDAAGTNTVFVVQDTGNTGIGTASPTRILDVSGSIPIIRNPGIAGFDFRNTGVSFGAAMVVGPGGNPNLYGNWSGQSNGPDDTTKPTWGLRLDVVNDLFRVLRAPSGGGAMAAVMDVRGNGSIASVTGASLSPGGIWTDASSRDYKENINQLTVAEAIAALEGLNPVKFNYKVDVEESHVGFIAEDVPALVATKDRKGLSSMDIVAVLTKVVQEQNKTIEALSAKIDILEKTSTGK